MPHALKKLLRNCTPLVLLVLAGCAKQGSPTGGPTDELPPKLVKASPKNFTTNVSPREIRLEFDEFFELGNPDKEWIIAPPLPAKPAYKIRGKKIIIELPDSLQEATTYTINFGASIKDLHEGNVLNNFRFVFSTGDYIDSGMVAGKVQYAETTEPAEDVAVGLFPLPLDSFPVDTPPLYFAKTEANGSFNLPYLKDSEYTILAWEDGNADQRWSATEPLAFIPEYIAPVFDSSEIDSVPLFLYTEVPDTLQITKFRLYNNHKVLLTYNGGPTDSLQVLSDSIAFVNQYGRDSTLLWYAQNRLSDSLKVQVAARTLHDTLTFFPVPPSNRNRDTTVELSQFTTPKKPGDSLFLTFSEPLLQDSFLLQYHVYPDSIVDSTFAYRSTTRATRFYANTPTAYETQVGVHYKALVTGLYKPHLDTLSFGYRIGSKEEFGTLKVVISAGNTSVQGPHFYWLVSGSQKTKIPGSNKPLTLKDLTPGSYTLFLVLDNDGDQEFSPGSIQEKRLPERVFKYPGKIDVRANWDLELTWKLNGG